METAARPTGRGTAGVGSGGTTRRRFTRKSISASRLRCIKLQYKKQESQTEVVSACMSKMKRTCIEIGFTDFLELPREGGVSSGWDEDEGLPSNDCICFFF